MTGQQIPSKTAKSSKEGPAHAVVSPTDRIRSHIDELFAQDKQLPEIWAESPGSVRGC
jgi:hypothetical protein